MADEWYAKKLGPLPLGIWMLLVGGGLALGFYLNGRNTDTSTADSAEMSDTSGIPGVGVGPGTPGFLPAGGPAPTQGPTTNEEWVVMAINGLIARGYDAALVDASLRNYIGNAELDARQYTLVELALKFYGSPPQPLGPPQQLPPEETPGGDETPPEDTPPTSKDQYDYIRVTHKAGTKYHTLYDIAEQVFGTGKGDQWQQLYNLNRGVVKDPDRITPGQIIRVPGAYHRQRWYGGYSTRRQQKWEKENK